MIKTRLMGLVPESKKYIVQNIVWQWLALVMNIAAIAAAGIFLESILTGKISEERAAVTALIIVCSMAVRLRINRPFCAARAVLRETTSGTANPKACGQAMTKTATATGNATAKSATVSQTMKARIPANRAA